MSNEPPDRRGQISIPLPFIFLSGFLGFLGIDESSANGSVVAAIMAGVIVAQIVGIVAGVRGETSGPLWITAACTLLAATVAVAGLILLAIIGWSGIASWILYPVLVFGLCLQGRQAFSSRRSHGTA
ncbi:hypothetical protein ACWDYH_15395 [Nocardia goodfellowii]